MDIETMQLQVKALAPIIADYVKQSVDALRSEIMMHMDDHNAEMMKGMDAMKTEMMAYMDECMSAMPMPMDGKDGINGVDGQNGIDGTPGKDGINGIDGKSVSMEDIKNEIAMQIALIELPMNGKDGANGINGKDGQPGQSGQPGRDATHIEILPGIDHEKSYVRGTYAKHNGGLWRSYEQTFGLKGWECIVDGIANLSIDQEGERGFKAIAQLSSGAISEKTITIPAQINRGVWRPGIYEKGDTVTWGGSQWHCEDITEDKPGAGSKDWLLIVKCGRPGKDGINGKDAPGVVKL